jgi:hypothetical protein
MPVQIAQYIQVRDHLVSTVHLSPATPDTIAGSLTSDGIYNANSAYQTQFIGSHLIFNASKIWNVHAETKCKLFSWLALHGKLLTADMLAVRGCPHDPTGPLCLYAPEMASRLCKYCP